jgi:outer membrane protein W
MPEAGSDTRYSMNMNTTSNHYFQESFQVTKRAVPTITVNQTYNDNLTVGASTGTTSRHHAGFAAGNGGTTNARALAEFNWTADAEL